MANQSVGAWSEAEDAKLRKLWPKGISASEIARGLPGRSRNAVIGRVHRLGMSQEGRAIPPRPEKLPRPKRIRASRAKPKLETAPAAPKPPRAPMGVPFPTKSPEQMKEDRARFAAAGKAVIAGTADAANDNAIRLLDRRFGQCAWPVGIPVRPAEQMVCGDAIYPEIENCSYCLIHAKRAFSRDITQPKPKDDLVRSARRWAA